jgi:hypothetical protein
MDSGKLYVVLPKRLSSQTCTLLDRTLITWLPLGRTSVMVALINIATQRGDTATSL